MRPYILAETNWKNVKDQNIDLAILPWGATEAHNYHLPYATDNILAEHIAAESARLAWEKGAKIMVLPAIPFGVNTGQTDIYLDINMHPSTQASVLDDIIEVLDRQEIHKLLIFNGHGGNNFKPILRELGVKYPKMFLSFCFYAKMLKRSKYFDEDGDHADEMETSLVQYVKPELVRSLEEAGEGRAKVWSISAFNSSWAWAERRWSEITEDTGIGNPKKATAEKGERCFKETTENISNFLIELANISLNEMYQWE